MKITKKLNVVIDGVKYKAVPFTLCIDCAFSSLSTLSQYCELAPCSTENRSSSPMKEVQFVRKMLKSSVKLP